VRKVFHELKVAAFNGLVNSRFVPRHFVAAVLSLISGLTGRGVKVVPDKDGGFTCSQGNIVLTVPRRARLSAAFPDIESTLTKYIETYNIHKIGLKAGDIVLDCGAHLGMVSVACQREGAEVYAFEPDPVEATALRKNLGMESHVFEVALWHSSGHLDLQLDNDSGNSSLIHADESPKTTSVETISLDEWCAKHIPQDTRIKLFKLEAEGAEPEILVGASTVLERIDYISADVGFERGVSQESTLAPVVEYLHERGFTIVAPSRKALSGSRLTLLFKNNLIA